MADRREKAALHLVGLFGQTPPFGRLAVELRRVERRGHLLHDRAVEHQVRAVKGHVAVLAARADQRQQRQAERFVGREEGRWREVLGRKTPARRRGRGERAQRTLRGHGQRIVAGRVEFGEPRVVDRHGGQVLGQHPENLLLIACGQEIGRQQADAIHGPTLADDEVAVLAPHGLADPHAGAIEQRSRPPLLRRRRRVRQPRRRRIRQGRNRRLPDLRIVAGSFRPLQQRVERRIPGRLVVMRQG